MPKERSTQDALVRTYLTTSSSRGGAVVYHARIVSGVGKFDRRGSGKTPAEAVASARSGKAR